MTSRDNIGGQRPPRQLLLGVVALLTAALARIAIMAFSGAG